MEMRVEQLAARSSLSVDTIRYYQSKGLLDPPRREGRVAWYDSGHLARLDRIRVLRQRGFTLATIARLVSGELDEADEALLVEISGVPPTGTDEPPGSPGTDLLTIDELAEATGVPLALLTALAAEGLLIPRRHGGHEYFTSEDIAASRAGLSLLEWGVPLSELLALARRHHQATEAVAREAVQMFSTYVRQPLRRDAAARTGVGAGGDADVDRLVRAYADLLPAVTTLVANHFARTLVNTALDHVEQVGSEAERKAVGHQTGGRSAPVPQR
jgi:DNA-binding transcriptional MerR regulator